jgi:hypothetical protein
MKRSSPRRIAHLVQSLRERISPHLPDKLNRSSLYVDLADAYQACNDFIRTIDKVVSKVSLRRTELETNLVDVDVHLLEHLNYHVESLRELVPQAIGALEERPEPVGPGKTEKARKKKPPPGKKRAVRGKRNAVRRNL